MPRPPPITTRATAARRLVPPRRALTSPVTASATSTATKVTGTRQAAGGARIATSGRSAPMVNDAAEAIAACRGLVRSLGSMPSSTSTWAANASCLVSSSATVRAVRADRPFARYRAASSASSCSGASASSRRSLSSIALSVSRWLLTDTYSPNAIEIAPATSPATPAVRIGPRVAVAPATPVTMPLALVSDGRFTLGIGAGERLNEHVVGQGFLSVRGRHERLREALEIIRLLWSGGYQPYEGKHLQLADAPALGLPQTL